MHVEHIVDHAEQGAFGAGSMGSLKRDTPTWPPRAVAYLDD